MSVLLFAFCLLIEAAFSKTTEKILELAAGLRSQLRVGSGISADVHGNAEEAINQESMPVQVRPDPAHIGYSSFAGSALLKEG